MSTRPRSEDRWIRRFNPAPLAEARLACFPHAGGSASYYRPFARQLAPSVDVLAMQYPGRQDRRTESCVDDVHTLADLAAAELRAWTDRPLALFGHSMGASVAFEVGLRLEAAGHRPVRLFASGRRAPAWPRAGDPVHQRDDDQLIAAVQRLGGTDARVFDEPELVRMILPVVRNDYRAAETYRCGRQAVLAAPVTVLTGEDDAEVPLETAHAWRAHTASEFNVRTFSGGHFYLHEHSVEVIREITCRLFRC